MSADEEPKWTHAGKWDLTDLDGVDVWIFAEYHFRDGPEPGRMVLDESAEPAILVDGEIVSLCSADLNGWSIRARLTGESPPPAPDGSPAVVSESCSASELVSKLTDERNAWQGRALDAEARADKLTADFARIAQLVQELDPGVLGESWQARESKRLAAELAEARAEVQRLKYSAETGRWDTDVGAGAG